MVWNSSLPSHLHPLSHTMKVSHVSQSYPCHAMSWGGFVCGRKQTNDKLCHNSTTWRTIFNQQLCCYVTYTLQRHQNLSGFVAFSCLYVVCFSKHTIIMSVSDFFFFTGSLSVPYWKPGNEAPPRVINGHNYVIEEWSAVRCKQDQMSRRWRGLVVLTYSGVSAYTKT